MLLKNILVINSKTSLGILFLNIKSTFFWSDKKPWWHLNDNANKKVAFNTRQKITRLKVGIGHQVKEYAGFGFQFVYGETISGKQTKNN